MVPKGETGWKEYLHVEAKNYGVFFPLILLEIIINAMLKKSKKRIYELYFLWILKVWDYIWMNSVPQKSYAPGTSM